MIIFGLKIEILVCSLNQTPGGLWASEVQLVAEMLREELGVNPQGGAGLTACGCLHEKYSIKSSPPNHDLRM